MFSNCNPQFKKIQAKSLSIPSNFITMTLILLQSNFTSKVTNPQICFDFKLSVSDLALRSSKLLVENIQWNKKPAFQAKQNKMRRLWFQSSTKSRMISSEQGKDTIYKYFHLITVLITCSFLHDAQKALPLVFLSTLQSN